MNKAITINPDDDLAVALTHLSAGEDVEVNGNSYKLLHNITPKHKFALKDFAEGDEMHMYGVIVGKAKEPIVKGAAVTLQNLTHKASSYDPSLKSDYHWTKPDLSRFEGKEFMGYHRSDGQVGTANYWIVFPLVFCENRNIETIKKTFNKALGFEKEDPYVEMLSDMVRQYQRGELNTETIQFKPKTEEKAKKNHVFENIDGVRFMTHQSGCGGIREDAETLCQLLAGYINNPNVAGATVLSLGCQNAEVKMFKDKLNKVNPHMDKPIYILDQQTAGKESILIQQAITQTFAGLIEANKISRKPAPLSKLTIGLECGGSDGFSGISANPSIGYTADLVTALGGKAILSEFPELCGVEQELINRMDNQEMAEKFVKIMRAYEQSAEAVGSGFDMNPSPGNIKDGLITDAMKSAGAAKKGGTSPVSGVLDYTEYAHNPGLNLLCTPGNDVESTTGLAGSGANIILFTTGLGTPTGNPITPVLKVSSNTQLAEKMPDIIDIDTGSVIRGEKSISEMGEEILDYILDVASGRIAPKAMELEQYDFIPWKRGVSL